MAFIGEFSAIGAAFLWSFSSFLFTSASIKLGSMQLNIDRMLIAAILLVLTIGIFKINYDISTAQFIWLTLSGIAGLVAGDTFLFKSFSMIGPRVSMLIMSGNPAIAAIMAYLLLGETLSFWNVLGIAVTLSGISLVILERPATPSTKFRITKMGVFYGFLGASGQAIGLILAKMAYHEGDIHSLMATFVRIGTAVIILLPLAVIVKRYKNPIKLYKADRKALGMVSLGSVIGPYLGITFSFLAIIYTKVGIASTLMATMPIIMLPLSGMIYKEKLTWKSVTGAFIAVGGVAMLFLA